MRERPILFSGPMVREILAGRKTQTRRPVKPAPGGASLAPWHHSIEVATGRQVWGFRDHEGQATEDDRVCPYGAPGDRLWVRETLRLDPLTARWTYAVDGSHVLIDSRDDEAVLAMRAWAHHKESETCVSIHMPRWASRLLLEVESVRVERLQAITEDDARAEGIEPFGAISAEQRMPVTGERFGDSPRRCTFMCRWDEMYEPGPFEWRENPWVWVVTFSRVESARSAA